MEEEFPYDLVVESEHLDEICSQYIVEDNGRFWRDNIEYVCLMVIGKIPQKSKKSSKKEEDANVEN